MNSEEFKTDEAWGRLCSAGVLADLVTDLVFVVDERYRVLRANKAFLSFFGKPTQASVCGRSFGEVADCRHAATGVMCGEAAACSGCGWLQAVEACKREGVGEHECRILKRGGDALDFAVSALPAGPSAGYVCGLKDLYSPKRLRVLELTFFHDVTNLAAGIRGLCELADDPDSGQDEELRPLIHDSANKLVDAIERVRTLRVAENGDLHPCFSAVEPGAVLQAVAESLREQASSRHVEVVIDTGLAPAVFETDKELLALVFGELVRNAIEASVRGDRVTLRCFAGSGDVCFDVRNPAVLAEHVRAHVFERSFTTRGSGRGVGAYRAKLIAERYLKGFVGFVSQAPGGTTFFIRFPQAATEP